MFAFIHCDTSNNTSLNLKFCEKKHLTHILLTYNLTIFYQDGNFYWNSHICLVLDPKKRIRVIFSFSNFYPNIWDLVLASLNWRLQQESMCYFDELSTKYHDYLDLVGKDLLKRRNRRVKKCGIEEFEKSSTFYKYFFY